MSFSPCMFLTDKHTQGCQSIKPRDTEKASAILYNTSSSKTNGHLDSTTPFHKVPVGNHQDHCHSETSFLVSLTFPKSVVVMFVSYAILLQDFICHPMEMWLHHLITSTALLLKKITEIIVFKISVTDYCLEQILPFNSFTCSFNFTFSRISALLISICRRTDRSWTLATAVLNKRPSTKA